MSIQDINEGEEDENVYTLVQDDSDGSRDDSDSRNVSSGENLLNDGEVLLFSDPGA